MADDGRYRLAPLRKVREQSEALRRGELADAVGHAKATEVTVAAAAARTTRAREALASALAVRGVGAVATPEQLVIAERYVARRRGELAAAYDEEARARAVHAGRLDVVDGARGELARARAEREVVERHFARWREAQKQLAERRSDE